MLFEPSATTRAAAEGHGMGLAICAGSSRRRAEPSATCRGRARGAEVEIRLPL
jgi:C4-dicarboxylate-specific signal transduction histidine kinase